LFDGAGFGFVALFLFGRGLLRALRLLRAYTNQPEANRESDEREDVQPALRFHASYFLRISGSIVVKILRRASPLFNP
jgi:hypothetical protein